MNENKASATTIDAPQPGDPRYDFAVVTAAVGELIAGVQDDQITATTPCPEFRVKELLEHIVLAMRRVAALGEGAEFYSINEEPVDGGWHDQYRDAAHDVMTAWTDVAKLDAIYTVPWGDLPGAAILGAYTGELAVHGWDLAQATGQSLEIADEVLEPSLAGAHQSIPVEIRADEMVPFGPVVDIAAEASTLDRLVGWFGRNVSA